MTSKPIFLCIIACALLAGCATSPTGRTQLLIISEQSAIAASKQAYTAMLTPLAQQNRINTDKGLNERVRRIADRVVQQAVKMRADTVNWEWDLQIIDDPKTVNAWAMAGGKMALYTGLVQVIDTTDDELAQVLAHEIAHALAKHSAEQMSVSAATNFGMQSVAIATGNSPIALQGSSLLAALAVSLPNSRTMETEADRIGIELAAKAGYNPNAAISLWDKMSQAGGAGQPQFLSTHPSAGTRKATLQGLVPIMMPFYEQAKR
ncbi:MAG: M48 family metallopeptidase [Proteobacteria bacterium]|nr:M48 family metallopeptidase [Pseudomonadota bacterium]